MIITTRLFDNDYGAVDDKDDNDDVVVDDNDDICYI